ncbi:efflux RND transporter periplasmic adaptor subunit [Ochrobactrum sp. EDr1-4]|uniref:efflux RND transporter periplasmic adaptor subunit n=1 Tax=Ochrobactrum sp. EDr1-4 TaxID=3368622 RepID=UPI003BA13400
MKRKQVWATTGFTVAAATAAAFFVVLEAPKREAEAADPRTAFPMVLVTEAKATGMAERSFTGTVAPRVQSNLGFRVPGKIIERMVDVGQQVRQGQALMRIDETDLQLALTAKRNTVSAAHAVLIQAQADEQRYAALVRNRLAATPQRYEQAKMALDTATAQLAAAEADAKVAENVAAYAVLFADSDGTIIQTLGDQGQVVAAGQSVIQLAQSGPREAVVWLPETQRPVPGSLAQASIYGGESPSDKATLRQISDSADPQTRTYEARYILEGDAASAPLGSTVTIKILDAGREQEVAVPVGAILDNGNRTGVWVVNGSTSTVKFTPVAVRQVGEEAAFVTGIGIGQKIVALGAQLLDDGASVRIASQSEVTK